MGLEWPCLQVAADILFALLSLLYIYSSLELIAYLLLPVLKPERL
jgi:hypothetical protein